MIRRSAYQIAQKALPPGRRQSLFHLNVIFIVCGSVPSQIFPELDLVFMFKGVSSVHP